MDGTNPKKINKSVRKRNPSLENRYTRDQYTEECGYLAK